jgi:molybdopterin-guanine dinucleotide biosynthesis protein A
MAAATSDGEGRLARVAAAVLVGGGSTRMGRDKADLDLGGESLLVRAVRRVSSLTDEVWIVGGPVRHVEGLASRWTADPEGPECALRGLVGALAASGREQVFTLAVDLPHWRPDLLLALYAHPAADAVVPRQGGRAQPLCALYRREPVLEAGRRRLAAGELSLHGLLEAVETVYLEGESLAALDPLGLQLTNVNTPEDWRAVRDG